MPGEGQAIRIAVDGPVASGKSSIGRSLAAALGFLYLDTGAMYRAIAALTLQRGIEATDEAAVTALAQQVDINFPTLGHSDAVNPPLLADGIDITEILRSPQVESLVSQVAAYPDVRTAMVARQRAIAAHRSVVMVGRDIGTVVLPDADLKIYLTASVEERARRRSEERSTSGAHDVPEKTLEALRRRDMLDSQRTVSPLRSAEDAVLLDTTGFTLEQSAQAALHLVKARLADRLQQHPASGEG